MGCTSPSYQRIDNYSKVALALILCAGVAALGLQRADIMSLLVVAPVVEELLFRGVIQEYLQRRIQGVWPVAIITGVLFSSAHMVLRSELLALWVFVPSLVLSFAYFKFRSLSLVVCLHACMNAVYLIVVNLYPNTNIYLSLA